MRKQIFVDPFGFCVHNKILWSINFNDNTLFGLDIKSMKIIKSYVIDNIEWNIETPTKAQIYSFDDVLVILMSGLSKIYYFSFENEEVGLLSEIPKSYCLEDAKTLQYNSKIIFVPRRTKSIYVFDIRNKVWGEYGVFEETVSVNNKITIDKDVLWITDSGSNKIYSIDVKTFVSETHIVGSKDTIFWGVIPISNMFVLPHNNKNKASLFDGKKVIKTMDYPKNYMCLPNHAYINNVAVYQNKVYLFPDDANMIIIIDIINKTVGRGFEKCSFGEGYIYYMGKVKWTSELFTDIIQNEDEVIAYSSVNQKWVVLGLADLTARPYEVICDSEEIENKVKKIINNSNKTRIIYENDRRNKLDQYICDICNL